MMFEVELKLDGVEKLLENHGLQEGGPVQKFFANELWKLSDPYIPFRSGPLKNNSSITLNGDAIIYHSPYARYHWYGKLMVDPITRKGAFYDPSSGRYWSRPKVKKVLTQKDLTYTGAPLRGPRWTERCWIDNKDSIIAATETYILSLGGKK